MSAQPASPCALTIAGSDSGGGAGVQADLRTFAALGVHGCSAITAVTAQNTQAVTGIWPLPVDAVAGQIQAVLDDIEVCAVKLGMLYHPDIVNAVARRLSRHPNLPVVCDPVMVATSGDSLAAGAIASCLRTTLMQDVTLITPNVDEAAALLDLTRATNVRDMQFQARRLVELGAPAALITGGHLPGVEAIDVLAWREGADIRQRLFTAARVATRHTHGTGCTLSAAIAAGLAKGLALMDAIVQAKNYVSAALAHADELSIGQGRGPLHHFFQQWRSDGGAS